MRLPSVATSSCRLTKADEFQHGSRRARVPAKGYNIKVNILYPLVPATPKSRTKSLLCDQKRLSRIGAESSAGPRPERAVEHVKLDVGQAVQLDVGQAAKGDGIAGTVGSSNAGSI